MEITIFKENKVEEGASEKRVSNVRSHFTLQWHLTAQCDQNCMHCYLYESSSYEREIKNELSFEHCCKIIDDFSNTFKNWGMPIRINFTGGDPLLRKDIFDLLRYARNKEIELGILGNPNLLNHDIAKKLKDVGVTRYQVSIDGLEKTHDRLRGRKGLFKDTIRAIHVLEEVGITSVVMFTLSRENADELIGVIQTVEKEGVSVFDFARIVPIGAGKQLKTQTLNPQEYKKLLLRVLEEYKYLQENGSKTYFGRKDHLWKLLYQELGLLKPLPKDKETIYNGCGIGSSILTILADGTVYACRRLPVEIGKVPEQSIRDIFINSFEHNKMRQVEKMEKCSKCELMQFCRGCPAVAYAAYGDYMSPDPQCWKEI
ncbi:MAG: radical SAM protein [Candidatus Firestonebacteria bacterium]